MAGGAIGGGGDMGRGSDICSIQCGPPKTAFAIAVLAIAVGLFALLAQALEGLQLYLCASVLLGTIGVAVVLTLCLREKKTITVAHAGAALDVPSERLAVTEPPVPRPHSALSQANFDSAPSTDQPTAAQPNLLFQSSNRNRKQKKSGFTCCGSWESSRSDIGAAALLLTQAGYAAGEMAGSAQLDAADGSPRSSPEAWARSRSQDYAADRVGVTWQTRDEEDGALAEFHGSAMAAMVQLGLDQSPDAEFMLSDQTLMRYLRARKGSVDLALEMWCETATWRDEVKPWHVDCHLCCAAPGTHTWRQIGKDLRGRPVVYSCIRQERDGVKHVSISPSPPSCTPKNAMAKL
jgi:hypothetical protein